MKSGLWAAVLMGSLLVAGSFLPAVAEAAPPPAVSRVEAGSPPVLLAQTSQESSGGRTRIPRGVVRLGIAGVIMAAGAVAWVIRKATGAE